MQIKAGLLCAISMFVLVGTAHADSNCHDVCILQCEIKENALDKAPCLSACSDLPACVGTTPAPAPEISFLSTSDIEQTTSAIAGSTDCGTVAGRRAAKKQLNSLKKLAQQKWALLEEFGLAQDAVGIKALIKQRAADLKALCKSQR